MSHRIALRAWALWLVACASLLARQPAPVAPDATSPPAGPDAARAPSIVVAEYDGIVHPITAEFFEQAVARAEGQRAEALILILRTPGGLLDSTRTITSRMIASAVPVVVFVAPSGSRAASAGFLIALAADVTAMAPGTSIGAAHPVSGDGAPVTDAVAKKAASDVAAYARTLADKRGRNVDLAGEAVTESRAFTDEEARTASPPLVDLVAADLDALIRALDGREVRRFDQRTVVPRTAGARVDRLEMSWRQRLLSGIAHPQIAYILFSLGTLGLTIELWSPGAILPGVVGGVCLLLAFFAFQILPVSYAGLLLILFGIVLLVIEVKVVSYGVLAVGGLVSLVLGAVFLFDTTLPELQVGLAFVLPVAAGLAAVVLSLVGLAVRAQRQRSVTGTSGMIGEVGRVLGGRAGDAPLQVAVHGEIWRARPVADGVAPPEGTAVEVVGVEGLTLRVRPVRPEGPS